MSTTLAIDYGSKNIGLALVRNHESGNEPLFAGTLKYDNFTLKKKVQPRADIRRTRRTRKTKKARLRLLHQSLLSNGISADKVLDIIRFCRRRGYKSLWDDEELTQSETKVAEDEILYRFSRETFFQALDSELQRILPQNQYPKALKICEKILNRKGDRFQEIRTIRIDNRGVSRCAWDRCNEVTPRRHNAVRDALAQVIYAIYQAPIFKDPDLKTKIGKMLDHIAALAKSVFTYYLVEGLKGKADADKDGLITVDEVYRYVYDKVPQATGQEQHPVKKGTVEGRLIMGVTQQGM